MCEWGNCYGIMSMYDSMIMYNGKF